MLSLCLQIPEYFQGRLKMVLLSWFLQNFCSLYLWPSPDIYQMWCFVLLFTRPLLVTKLSLFTCQGDCDRVPRGWGAEVQCQCAARGSQPEVKSSSSLSSQSGLWAEGEAAPQIKGTGQLGFACGEAPGLCRAGRSGGGNFTEC